jgi:hypothetical protein
MTQTSNITPGTNYTVQANDNLTTIALRAYGNAGDWPVIYNFPANKKIIGSNPNLLQPGMVLFIPKLTTPADTSKGNPAIANFNGALYLAWTGTDARGSLNIASSTDGGANFGAKTTLNETSATGPALAAFNNKLFIAWVGTDASHSLNIASSSDGKNFGNTVTLPQASNLSPVLTVAGNKLFIAWTGTDQNPFNVQSSTDGVHFS